MADPPEDQDATPPRGQYLEPPVQIRPAVGIGKKLIAVMAAGVVVTAAGVYLYLTLTKDREPWIGEEIHIRILVDNFANAVDTQDQAKILNLLCAEEAADFTEDDDYDPTDDGPAAEPQGGAPSVTTSDIHVTGDTASARVARAADNDPRTLYFRKEGGIWKVCAPAAGPPSGGTPPSSR